MDRKDFHGWQAPLVVKTSDEIYGRILWKFLPFMEIPSIHGWKISMGEMQHKRCHM